MKIEYLGHSCFRITSSNGTVIITDPYTKVGYELPNGLNADIVTISHGHFDHNYINAVNYRKIADKAQKYVGNDVEIVGVNSWHDPKQGALRGGNVIFKISLDGMTVCHLGDLGEEYSSALSEKIGKIDILLIPVGGTYTIDAIQAKEYIEQLAPKVVIPMHYKPIDGQLDIAGSDKFLSTMAGYERMDCLNGIVELLPIMLGEQSKIIYMERKN